MNNKSSSAKTNYIEQCQIKVIDAVTNDFSPKLIYHNISRIKRVIEGVNVIGEKEGLSEKEMEYCLIAAWLFHLGFADEKNFENIKEVIDIYHKCIIGSSTAAEAFLKSINYPAEDLEEILMIFKNLNPQTPTPSKLSNVVHDAFTYEWTQPKARKRLKKLYSELLLVSNFKEGRRNWTETMVEYVNSFEYYTAYGKKYLTPKKDDLAFRLGKEIKDLSKVEKIAIQRQLGITDDEIKSLSKKLKSVSGRDERGVQTMFRTTIKNHYTLNEMVDRKSNIMISVNAIIMSLLITQLLSLESTLCIHSAPFLLMLMCSAFSIVFAIVAIRPAREHGQFTELDVRNKKGNLLYFGNFYKMPLREYYWGMMQMLNDSEYLYTTMVRDLYYLGQKLGSKYRSIRLSLNIFMLGTIISLIFFLIVSSMPDFHL